MKTWWNRLSIKARLMIWYVSILLAVLAINAAMIFFLLKTWRYAALDHQLAEDIEATEEQTRFDSNRKLIWRGNDYQDDDEDHGPLIEIWMKKDLLLQTGADRLGKLPPLQLPAPPQSVFRSALTSKGVPVRILARPSRINNVPVTIRVARNETAIHRELNRILLIMLTALPISALLAGAGGYFLAGRMLGPVKQITDQARKISAECLEERIPVDNPDDELGQLATVLNNTLARLEYSFRELRRFTSDASHELRTPLTVIRSVGEVGLRTARDENTLRDTISSMLEEVDILTRMVEDLLTLSRADKGSIPLQQDDFLLEDLAREVMEFLNVLAEEAEQSLVLSLGNSVRVQGDRGLLRHAVVNLVDNAIKYSPRGSTVTLRVYGTAQQAILEVRDNGPGLSPEHQAHVFDRFYRVDKARSKETGGTGLGLSIARRAVQLNGGKIVLETPESGGCIFRIILPRTPENRTEK